MKEFILVTGHILERQMEGAMAFCIVDSSQQVCVFG